MYYIIKLTNSKHGEIEDLNRCLIKHGEIEDSNRFLIKHGEISCKYGEMSLAVT